jgi:hypothetical protein
MDKLKFKEMANNPLLSATVKATGKKVNVYRHYKGSFVDYKDCKTMYKESDLEFLK